MAGVMPLPATTKTRPGCAFLGLLYKLLCKLACSHCMCPPTKPSEQIAADPVWAKGTRRPLPPAQISSMHQPVKRLRKFTICCSLAGILQSESGIQSEFHGIMWVSLRDHARDLREAVVFFCPRGQPRLLDGCAANMPEPTATAIQVDMVVTTNCY